jgi:RND family efflux transporter MFP subunit
MSSDYDLDLAEDTPKSSSTQKIIHKIPRKVRIVFFIILVASLIIFLLNAFKPEANKRSIPETIVRVEAIQAVRSNYPIIVNANGTVQAETRGNLVAQIRGEIVAVSNNFRTGGSFRKGDLLIQLDQRDYQAELSGALAQLSQAEAVYRQEQATSKQAVQDWQRLGNTSPAPDLVLRKPQLTAAKAQYDSAKAAHDTAKLNLSRTAITAPYDGRIIERRAVLGQYVSIGSPIAEVFATDGVEIRLPISQEEFSQLGLDDFVDNANDDSSVSKSPFKVSITSTIGSQAYQWDATITRTDSTFDINTRQIDIIAEVSDPFGKISGQPALKIGQFVSARIEGRTIENIFVIPNKSIREGSYVYAVREGKLAKQSIDILWQDDQNALISDGVEIDELVVTTSLNSTLAGASAKLATEPEANTDKPTEDALSKEVVAGTDSEATLDAPKPSTSTSSAIADAAQEDLPLKDNSIEPQRVSAEDLAPSIEATEVNIPAAIDKASAQ